MNQHPKFPGWEPPLENWSKLPHAFINLMPDMKLSELKVTLYILRHTWGFGNYSEPLAMTVDELRSGRKIAGGTRLDNGTGLSKQSVITGVRSGVARGTLIETKDESDKARIKKAYGLRGLNIGQEGSKFWTSEVEILDPDLNKDTYKENLTPPSATVKPKRARKRSEREQFSIEMEKSFCVATGIQLPLRNTKKEKRSAGVRWSIPLWHMYDWFRPEEERSNLEVKRGYDRKSLAFTMSLINEAVKHMQSEKLTISAPASIEQVAQSIYASGYQPDTQQTDFWQGYMTA